MHQPCNLTGAVYEDVNVKLRIDYSYSDIRKNVYLEQHTFHSLDSFNTKDLWYHRPKVRFEIEQCMCTGIYAFIFTFHQTVCIRNIFYSIAVL